MSQRKRLSDEPAPAPRAPARKLKRCGLFDDDRPLNGYKQRELMWGYDLIPTWHITFPKPGRFKIIVFLRTSSKGYSHREAVFKIADLPNVVEDFLDDPEACICEWFGYEPLAKSSDA